VYDSPPRTISMSLASSPSTSSTAARTIASRSGAGVIARAPAFCHGTLATTSNTLSKTITRQGHFGWHLRVFLYASLALLAVAALPALLAFAFSWPWLTDFDFIGSIVVIAAALYFHLLAVEQTRHRVLKWAAATCAVVGVAVAFWFNVQRTDQFGDELYMSHLFPPALRLARPVPVDAFVDGLATLQSTLDKKAKEPARGDDGPRGDDE